MLRQKYYKSFNADDGFIKNHQIIKGVQIIL